MSHPPPADGDFDGDGTPDAYDLDDDGDGIDDLREHDGRPGRDTDRDGQPDARDRDADGDGIGDRAECGGDTDSDGVPDRRDTDADGDGLGDADEAGPMGTPRDTDRDGAPDFQDTDADGDGLSHADERAAGTAWRRKDTDGDGFDDGVERAAGANPNDPDDGVEGVVVVLRRRDVKAVRVPVTVYVGRVDVALLPDVSASRPVTGTRSVLSQVIADTASLPDAAVGVGAFVDYAYGSFGASGVDKPFVLLSPITQDEPRLAGAVADLEQGSGADGTEAGMEALYQAVSGAGYDQDCDGVYDPLHDVPPLLASEVDPFRGTQRGAKIDLGTRGGFGFREFAIPFVVLIQDNKMRDPSSRDPDANRSPGGCPGDATHADVVAAAAELDAIPLIVQVVATDELLAAPRALAAALAAHLDPTSPELAASLVLAGPAGEDDIAPFVAERLAALGAGPATGPRVRVAVDTAGLVAEWTPEALGALSATTTVDVTLTLDAAVPASADDQVGFLRVEVVDEHGRVRGATDVVGVVTPR